MVDSNDETPLIPAVPWVMRGKYEIIEGRRTGNTTRMILAALIEAIKPDRPRIVIYAPRQIHLADRIAMRVIRAAQAITDVTPDVSYCGGSDVDWWFIDHFERHRDRRCIVFQDYDDGAP